MTDTSQDILGDIFTGAITYGERGQFFTPEGVCDLMAAMSVPMERTSDLRSVCDPACGSGRMLPGVAKYHPQWELTGQDVDHRAAQMTAINLGLYGLRGWAVWQNALTLECHRVYRIGMNWSAGGVITEIPIDRSPFDNQPVGKSASGRALHSPSPTKQSEVRSNTTHDHVNICNESASPSQLDLF